MAPCQPTDILVSNVVGFINWLCKVKHGITFEIHRHVIVQGFYLQKQLGSFFERKFWIE